MAEFIIPYQKKRAEFGRHAVFADIPTQILESIPSRFAARRLH
jgi:hypothetical protein